MPASHLRIAAGAALLSAGLLVASSGGAVALAEPDSTASTAQAPRGSRESNQDSRPAAKVTDTLRKTVQDIAGAVGANRKPARLPSATAASPTTSTGHARTSTRRSAVLPATADTSIPNAAASTLRAGGVVRSGPGRLGPQRG